MSAQYYLLFEMKLRSICYSDNITSIRRRVIIIDARLSRLSSCLEASRHKGEWREMLFGTVVREGVA